MGGCERRDLIEYIELADRADFVPRSEHWMPRSRGPAHTISLVVIVRSTTKRPEALILWLSHVERGTQLSVKCGSRQVVAAPEMDRREQGQSCDLGGRLKASTVACACSYDLLHLRMRL
jgi:hypothetical protein